MAPQHTRYQSTQLHASMPRENKRQTIALSLRKGTGKSQRMGLTSLQVARTVAVTATLAGRARHARPMSSIHIVSPLARILGEDEPYATLGACTTAPLVYHHGFSLRAAMPGRHREGPHPGRFSAWRPTSTAGPKVAGGHWTTGCRDTATPRIFPGPATAVPVACSAGWHAVSTARLACTARHSLWHHTDLPGVGTASWDAWGGACRGARQRPQPHRYRDPLPPSHR